MFLKKTNPSSWISPAIIKSSKRKQNLYIKFLKNKSHANEERYKQYKKKYLKGLIIFPNIILLLAIVTTSKHC